MEEMNGYGEGGMVRGRRDGNCGRYLWMVDISVLYAVREWH